MEKMNDGVLPEGQIFFTPSRNPYAVLPGFIKGWAITDLVFSGIWCACALVLILVLILFPRSVMMVAPQLLFAALVGGIGIGASVTLLNRKPGSLSLCRMMIVITLLHLVWHGFLMWVLWSVFAPHAGWQIAMLLTGVLLFLIRVALLVFYWITVVKAARYFADRRRQIGF